MESHDKTDNYGGLIDVEMPVEMTPIEKEVEDKRKQATKQRNEKRKAKGADLIGETSNKRQQKGSSIFLERKENFEVTCWMLRHSKAWRKKDQRRDTGNPNNHHQV